MAEANPGLHIQGNSSNIIQEVPNPLLPHSKIKDDISTRIGLKSEIGAPMSSNIIGRRSPNQATIFLYGISRSGTSATLNNLLASEDIKIPSNGGEVSVTQNVTEYGCYLKGPQSGDGELKIGFIDTPGWNSIGGNDINAENLKKISHFITLHPEIGNSKCRHFVYPNIVLVVVNANDNRLFGTNSLLIQVLDNLNKLKLVDTWHPNVIILVTHVMTIPPTVYADQSQCILECCKKMTKAFLSIVVVPVVFIENNFHDSMLKQEGEWHVLPDGTIQPLNLIEAMMNLMKESEDEVGREAVRLFFSNRCKFQIKVTAEGDEIQFPMTSPSKSIPKNNDKTKAENYIKQLEHIMNHIIHRTKLARRSTNQATIFVYGKSGDGKSTTLNYLFESNIIPTSNESSCTRDVAEYGCSIDSLKFPNKLKIGFIDTPGYGDIGGRTPEILAKISHFISSHPELESSRFFNRERNYPNIVMIAVSATDERLNGIYSYFSRMLHVLTKLNVVDSLHPNVVIIVTHAIYLSNNKDNYIDRSKKIEANCKNLVRAHFSIEAPVVFIENSTEEYKMEQEGQWHILPDGATVQPLNLFGAMTKLMAESGDEIGIEAVRLLFSESRRYRITKIRSSPGNINVQDSLSKWRQCIEEEFFLEDGNEIYSILSQQFHTFPLVYNLQKIHIIKPNDLRNMDLMEIKQAIHPFQLTKKETEWLIQLLEVARLRINLEFDLLGLGYSREFKEKRKRILEINPLERIDFGNYSMKVPNHCSIKNLRQIAVDIKSSEDAKWYIIKCLKITFRIYYVLFQVGIEEKETFNLNTEFIRILESLPKGIAPDNFENRFENPNFLNFVKNYGLYCHTGLYFGGFCEGVLYFDYLQDKEANERFLAEISANLLTMLERYSNSFQKYPNMSDLQSDTELSHKLINCPLTWRGGDKKYHYKNFLDLNVIKWNNWTNSIGMDVVCLDRIVNSKSLFEILSSSKDEKISCYARDFEPITTGRQTGLEDLMFVGSLGITACLETRDKVPGASNYQEERKVMTRIEASNRAGKLCPFL